jgi:hypothetical protein
MTSALMISVTLIQKSASDRLRSFLISFLEASALRSILSQLAACTYLATVSIGRNLFVFIAERQKELFSLCVFCDHVSDWLLGKMLIRIAKTFGDKFFLSWSQRLKLNEDFPLVIRIVYEAEALGSNTFGLGQVGFATDAALNSLLQSDKQF